jgi:hypothetical protein
MHEYYPLYKAMIIGVYSSKTSDLIKLHNVISKIEAAITADKLKRNPIRKM